MDLHGALIVWVHSDNPVGRRYGNWVTFLLHFVGFAVANDFAKVVGAVVLASEVVALVVVAVLEGAAVVVAIVAVD